MKNLEKNYHNIFIFFLALISISLIFRVFSTNVIIAFVVFNALFFKKLKYNKIKIYHILIIASPFLLNALFFLNNDSLYEGFKSGEKYASMLMFPLIILGYNKKIDINKLLKFYAICMVGIVTLLFIRYVILFNDNFLKYLSGKHLWEMGYDFTKSFNIHAPSLNLHMSFVSIICLYLLLRIDRKNAKKLGFYIFLFALSFLFVLYINTRIAVLNSIFGFVIIIFYNIFLKENLLVSIKKLVVFLMFIAIGIFAFTQIFPFTVKKFTKVTFSNMDMVGRLDEFDRPETKVFNSLVTRVSIWKSALELSKTKPWIGFGAADSKRELVNYYQITNQNFLTKYKFPVHNQYLDFILKFGVLGLLTALFYIGYIGYLGFKLKHPIPIALFVIFFISNVTDDFLILYSGIAFSAFWFCIFANAYLNNINGLNES